MTDKGRGILAYLLGWIGGLIVLYGMPDSQKKERVHGAQSIIASVAYMIIFIIISIVAGSMSAITYTYGGGWIPILIFRLIFSGLYLAVIIMGLIKVANEAAPELPLFGKLAHMMFLRQINKEPIMAPDDPNAQKQGNGFVYQSTQNNGVQNGAAQVQNQGMPNMQQQTQPMQGFQQQTGQIPVQNANVNINQVPQQSVGQTNMQAQINQNVYVPNNNQINQNPNNNGAQIENNYNQTQNQTQIPNVENNNMNN